MNYYEDAIKQLSYILERYNTCVIEVYENNIQKGFLTIYALNYLSNRVEVKNLFESQYYKISFSCLLESFSLLICNYPRGASLVLRSSIENFVKYIIEQSKNDKYTIHDRSYTVNKNSVDSLIKEQYDKSTKDLCICLNSTMETLYSKLSGISHSLVPESKDNTLEYFSDMGIIKKEFMDDTIGKFNKTIKTIFNYCLIICKPSLKSWDSSELKELLLLVFGKRKSRSSLKMIKN